MTREKQLQSRLKKVSFLQNSQLKLDDDGMLELILIRPTQHLTH